MEQIRGPECIEKVAELGPLPLGRLIAKVLQFAEGVAKFIGPVERRPNRIHPNVRCTENWFRRVTRSLVTLLQAAFVLQILAPISDPSWILGLYVPFSGENIRNPPGWSCAPVTVRKGHSELLRGTGS